MASAKQSIPFPVFSQLHTRTEPITQLELELFLATVRRRS